MDFAGAEEEGEAEEELAAAVEARQGRGRGRAAAGLFGLTRKFFFSLFDFFRSARLPLFFLYNFFLST